MIRMTVTLKATQRENLKHSATKKLRQSGHVPAVLYGKKDEASSIAVNSIELVKTVRDEGRNAIISLDVENGKTVDVMLHEYQMDPIKDELIHADFYVVDMKEEMDVEVPLRVEGEEVRAKPADIPEEITVDVSELEIGDTISLTDLPTSDKYEFLDDDDTTIATVVPPTEEEPLEEDEEEDAAQEPELVNAEEDEEEEN